MATKTLSMLLQITTKCSIQNTKSSNACNSRNKQKQIFNKQCAVELHCSNYTAHCTVKCKEMLHYKSIVHTQKHIYDSFSVERKISVRTVIESCTLCRMKKYLFLYAIRKRRSTAFQSCITLGGLHWSKIAFLLKSPLLNIFSSKEHGLSFPNMWVT